MRCLSYICSKVNHLLLIYLLNVRKNIVLNVTSIVKTRLNIGKNILLVMETFYDVAVFELES